MRANGSLASPNSKNNFSLKKGSKPERNFIPFTNEALERIMKRYKCNRESEADSERKKNSMSGYNTTQLWTAKLEKPTAKLVNYPEQLAKWNKMNRILAKR